MRKITYWLSLVLVFIVPWEDSISVTAMGSLAKVMGVIVAGFWGLTMLIEGRFRKPHWFHIFVLLFFLWNAVSIFWSPFVDSTLQRIKTDAQIFILMLILWEMYQKPSDLMSAIQAYILGTFVLIFSSISNYLHGNVAVAYEGRYSATGVNAVDLTLILMLGLPIALQLFFMDVKAKKSGLLKFVNLAYIPLAIFSILLTGSRTSLIAIAPFFIYIALSKQIHSNVKLIVASFLIITGLLLLPFLPQSVISRLGTVGESIGSADLGGRVGLWVKAILVWSEHPLLGIGGGALDGTIGSAAHNTFISVAAETGFIGFVLFLAILLIVLVQAWSLPNGNSGLWVAIFFTWVIGVSSLSWEFRKLTWLVLTFVVIEGSFTREQLSFRRVEQKFSEGIKRLIPTEETSEAI